MVVTRRAAASAASQEKQSTPRKDETIVQSHERPSANRLQQILLLITLATGICACYLSYGLVQERLFSPTSPHGRAVRAVGGPITTFLVLTQAMGNTAVAALWTWMQNRFLSNPQHGRRQQQIRKDSDIQTLNHKLLLLTAFCYFGAMASSNEAINWVSYPTVVLAKSSKLIPSMVAGVTLERRSYSAREWGGALLITSGIVVFNYTRLREQNDTSNNARPDSPFGLLLLGISLMFDGALSACQGSTKRSSGRYRPPTAMEFMAYTNAYAFVFLFPACIVSGQLKNGMGLLLGDGTDGGEGDAAAARRWILLLNATAAAGQVFIFLTIHCFSSIMCTTITTMRKFVSILLSVRHFGHVFSPVQWTSVGCVFVGLYMEIVAKISDGSSDGGNNSSTNNGKSKRQ